MKSFLNLIIIALLSISCTATHILSKTNDRYFDDAYECQTNADQRIGALCNDSTYSKSIGSGACSHHGGVKVWLCK